MTKTAFTKTAVTEMAVRELINPWSEQPDGSYRLEVYERDAAQPKLRRVVAHLTIFDRDQCDLLVEHFVTSNIGEVIDLTAAAHAIPAPVRDTLPTMYAFAA